jgi:hypothetical protein
MSASGFFSAEHRGSTGNDAGCYTTAFRFLVKHSVNVPPQEVSLTSSALTYRWEKLGFVTFHPSPKSFTIFCFGIEDDAQAHFRRQIFESNSAVLEAHPLSIHNLVLKYILKSLDRAVWSWRDVVRRLETSRLHCGPEAVRDFNHMHEIARHLIHSTEMLTTALSVVESMAKECDFVRNGVGDQATFACRRELEFVCSLIRALLHRSSALEKRMENEMALVGISLKALLLYQEDGHS